MLTNQNNERKAAGQVVSTKLSIIIPVYNAEPFLRKTLDSVLEQSLKEIEVICVDDGSTDSSLSILHEYEGKDPRVKVLCQQNQYAGAARNKGLEAATGKYIHFLDADDSVLPYAYEALYNKMVKYDLDMIRCAALDWDVQRKCYVEIPRDSLSKLRPGDFNRLVGTEDGSPLYKVGVTPWEGLYRRSFLMEKGIRFDELFCVNDRSFFTAALTNSTRTMISRDRLVLHNTNQAASLIGKRAQNFDCHFRSIENTVKRMAKDGIESEVQERVLNECFIDLFAWFCRFCKDPELAEAAPDLRNSILEQTAQFVGNYRGPFGYTLRMKYNKALRQIETLNGTSVILPKTHPIHEACEMPKVSVVVPTYNVEDYLNEALHSLTTQTLEEIEFICVNDGATDGSLVIMKEYAAIDKRFRILDGPNGGYGKAMNRGIDAARGEYLGILEPDDFVSANMFEELYNVAHENDLDLVKADFYRFMVNPNGSLAKKVFHLSGNQNYYNRVLSPLKEPQTFTFVINTWSGIYRMAFINRFHIRHNETPGASYQDNGFWFQTFCHAQRAYFVNKPYYMNRRDNPNSSMYSKGKMYAVTEEYRFIKERLEEEPELFQKVQRIYYAKKLSNFFVTLYRLDPSLQLEYLHHMRDEFKEPYEQDLIDPEFIGKSYWNSFPEIMADPDAWHEHVCVSVVIPVYNTEKYLRQTLNSILFKNEIRFEVICVDDGSTDNSLAILREYEAKDPRVHVITQANAGAGAARNAGMKFARGEYLSFLDADDVFEPDVLCRAYDKARELDADIVVYRCDLFDDETGQKTPGQYAIKDALLPVKQPFAGADIPIDIFRAFVGWPWDKLFRASFVRDNNLKFQEQRTTNDLLFVYSAIVKAQRIAIMNTILAHHRRHGDSISTTREKSWRCFYDALIALRNQLKAWGLYETREQDFINYSLQFSLWHVNTLRRPAYYALYNKLKDEWLAELGVTDHEMGYFYNRWEYYQLQQLLSLDADEFQFWRSRKERTAANDRIRRLNSQVSTLRASNNALSERFSIFATARIDIKNAGTAANDIEILELSDPTANCVVAEWDSNKTGKSHLIRANAKKDNGKLSVKLRCKGDGDLQFTLRGLDIRDENGKRIPAWIFYKKCSVNDKEVFTSPVSLWHDLPCEFSRKVSDGEIVTLQVEWESDARAAVFMAHKELDIQRKHANTSIALQKRAKPLDARLKDAYEINRSLDQQLKDIRSGMSFRIGRIITYIPRKILGRD